MQKIQDAEKLTLFSSLESQESRKPVNTVNIQGSSFCWGTIQQIKVEFSDWLWLESGPDARFLRRVWAVGVEKRLISQERTMSLFYGTWKQLHHLDVVGLCESGWGVHVWAQVVWFWSSVSVCVASGDVSLLHSTSQLWTF